MTFIFASVYQMKFYRFSEKERIEEWSWVLSSSSSDLHPVVSCKRSAFKNFAKSTGKHLCQSFFCNKVAGWGLFVLEIYFP